MSRFAQVYEPVEEGWGHLASALTLPTGIGYVLLQWHNIKKVMGDPKVQKYIKSECDRLLKEEKKSNKTATPKIPSGLSNFLKKNSALRNNTKLMERLKNPSGGQFNIGQYTVVPFGDTDHVESIIVLFYIGDSDNVVGRKLKPPTKQDLKDLGLRKEEV